jgi:hypothetical protein
MSIKRFFPDLSYHIPRGSALGYLAAVWMALSLCFRVWYLATGSGYTPLFFITQGILPIVASLLFILFLLAFSRHNLPLTIVPMLMGCVFFFFRATSLGTVHMILCMCLYVVIAALYSLTVTGYIPTKKPLWILFAAALAYHIFVEDLPALIQGGLTVRDCLPEASVLSIMASLLCVALAIVPDRTWLK